MEGGVQRGSEGSGSFNTGLAVLVLVLVARCPLALADTTRGSCCERGSAATQHVC